MNRRESQVCVSPKEMRPLLANWNLNSICAIYGDTDTATCIIQSKQRISPTWDRDTPTPATTNGTDLEHAFGISGAQLAQVHGARRRRDLELLARPALDDRLLLDLARAQHLRA